MEELLSNGKILDLEERKDKITNIFFSAIKNCEINTLMKILIDESIKPWELVDDDNMTGLIRAAFQNLNLVCIKIIEILKKRLAFGNEIKDDLKEYINKQCINGNSVLHYAAFKGNLDIINLCINYGGDYTLRNKNGLTVLHMAAQNDQAHILVYFREKYNMDIYQTDYAGSSPLHWAAIRGCNNSIKFLLPWMDDINIKDKLGLTPLHLAVTSGKILK